MQLFGFDLSEISGTIGMLRETSGGLAEGIAIAGKVAEYLRGEPEARKQAEIVGLLGDLNQKLVQVQVTQTNMMHSLYKAEAALRAAQAQHDEFQRYQLVTLPTGAKVLALKESDRNGEPAHYLCQPCSTEGKKLVLQPFGHSRTTLECPRCKHLYRTAAENADIRFTPRDDRFSGL
jgi:hypothetical protein